MKRVYFRDHMKHKEMGGHFLYGPATHRVRDQSNNEYDRWHLPSSSVTLANMDRNSPGGSTRRRASSVTSS